MNRPFFSKKLSIPSKVFGK